MYSSSNVFSARGDDYESNFMDYEASTKRNLSITVHCAEKNTSLRFAVLRFSTLSEIMRQIYSHFRFQMRGLESENDISLYVIDQDGWSKELTSDLTSTDSTISVSDLQDDYMLTVRFGPFIKIYYCDIHSYYIKDVFLMRI